AVPRSRHSGLAQPVLGLTLALLAVGCASSATSLKPAHIPAHEGALFGRVTIDDEGEDVTSKCYVDFSDRNENTKAHLSLDKTGWVFASVQTGSTELSGIVCTLGGLFKYNAGFHPKNLAFDV